MLTNSSSHQILMEYPEGFDEYYLYNYLTNETILLANMTTCWYYESRPELYKMCLAAFGFYQFNETEGNRPFVPSWGLQTVWTVMFSFMVLSAIVGNLIVIMIILSYEQMRTKTNIFLLNLSVADIMMATFNTMFNFIFMLKSHWPFGQTYCMINNFLASLATASSVFTITATCFDRYMAVVHPFKPRMNKTTSLIVVMLTWLFAAILSLPTLLYSTTYELSYQDGSRVLCWLHWPDGVQNISQYDHIYNIVFFVVTYVIPMFTMGLTYTRMSFVLWGSKQIGEMTSHQREAIRSKQKVVPMLIIVTIIFGICWLPYQVYFLVVFYIIELGQKEYVQHIYLAFYWLAMFNSSLNPIIYCLLNKRFRKYSKKIILRLSQCRETSPLSHGRPVSVRSVDCSNLDHEIVNLSTYVSKVT